MSIEIKGGQEPSHTENLIYDVLCFSCPKVSEEDGDYLPGPDELADITQDLTLDQAIEVAKQHERRYGESHEIVIRAFDIGIIQDTIYNNSDDSE